MIYLDNCATTRPRREVASFLARSIREEFSNPSSLHSLGFNIEKKIKSARQDLADLLGVRASEIYFSSGATESNNIILQGLIRKNLKRSGRIITSPIEHPSVKNVIESFKDQVEVVYLKPDDKGQISLEDFKGLLNKDTFLVSLMHVNNELGTIYPIEEIGQIIKDTKTRALFHVDGTQGFLKIPLNLSNVDLYSASSHKVYGPKGVGLIYKNSKVHINPISHGGSQEGHLRPGTENTNSIMAFALAANIMAVRSREEYKLVDNIKKSFIEGIMSKIPDTRLNSPEESSPYIVSLSFKGIRGETLLHFLEGDEIYISTSSACSRGMSHVVEEIGLPKDYGMGTVRVCFSYENSLEEVGHIVESFEKYVKELRDI